MWKRSEESGGKRGSLFAGRRKAVASSTPERGYWHVWTAEEAIAAHFKTVPAVERVLLNCSVAQVTAVLQDRPGPAGWWPSSTKLDSTTISLLEREQGRVRYLRNSKTTNGLIQTRIRLWTTQWVDVLDAHAAVVQMHQWDESGAVHLISRLCCTDGAPLGHGIDSVLVRFEEETTASATVVSFASSTLVKAHAAILERIATLVADPMPKASKASLPVELVPWTSLSLDQVHHAIRNAPLVRTRQWNLRPYPNVFVANEAVDWLVAEYPLSRDDSVALMRALQTRGALVHAVDAEKQFADAHLFFRWADAGSTGVASNGSSNEPIPTDAAGDVDLSSSAAETDGASLAAFSELQLENERLRDENDALREELYAQRDELFCSVALGLKLVLSHDGGMNCNCSIAELLEELPPSLSVADWPNWIVGRLRSAPMLPPPAEPLRAQPRTAAARAAGTWWDDELTSPN